MHNRVKEGKLPRYPGRIIVRSDIGEIMDIKSSSLIRLFFSDELNESFNKNPDKEYSIKDLCHMTNPRIPLATVRGTIRFNLNLFETDETLRITKQGIMSIKVARLKPIWKHIFKSVKEIQDGKK